MVKLRSASANTKKGGEDTFNPSSVESNRDSLSDSADGSQGSESDTSSEDQRSNEDGGSTSRNLKTTTEDSSDHQFNFPFEFPEEKGSKADTNRASEQLRTEIRRAPLTVRNEVFRLRTEGKDLRGQVCAARTELNEVKKLSRYQASLIIRLEGEIDNLNQAKWFE